MVMTLLFIPQMAVTVGTKGLYGMRNYADSQFTLGNLGYSKSECI